MPITYVIADMHGRDDLFDAALEILGGQPPGRLIVLGDFIDRGPGSARLVERLIAGPPPGWRWDILLGNHEAMMIQVLGGRWASLEWWVGNGGGSTLASYGYRSGDEMLPLKVPAAHLDWLAQLPLMIADPYRVYVHAGVDRDRPLEDQDRETLTWKRYGHSDALGHGAHHVVHGHTQSPQHPLLLEGRTNLDAAAYRTGRLAIGVFDDDLPGGPVDVLWATT